MDERRKIRFEQTAYLELRRVITEEFTTNPVEFMTKYRKRPEDFSGADLRDYYRSKDFFKSHVSLGPELFKSQFRLGEFFPPIQAF